MSERSLTDRLASELKRMESFEEFFVNQYHRVVSILLRLVGDRARAEELANDVFWKAYRQPSVCTGHDNAGGWLYRTATNLGIDALRATARRSRYEQSAGHEMLRASTSASPLDEVLREERRCRVRAVLASLKPSQAQILILRSTGLSYNELAESLGVQRGSVGTMLVRAEAEFRKRYRQMHGDEEDL